MRNSFRKILATLLALTTLFAFGMAAGEQTAGYTDVTYYSLYTQIMNCVDNKTPDNNLELLHMENASVWKKSDTLAGFQFEGKEWDIIGECDIETGLITRVLCRIPSTQAGLLMIYGVTFCLSGEQETSAFYEKYVPDDAVLRDLPFPEYKITMNGGAEEAYVFEYVREASMLLHNDANKCPMAKLIEAMQK